MERNKNMSGQELFNYCNKKAKYMLLSTKFEISLRNIYHKIKEEIENMTLINNMISNKMLQNMQHNKHNGVVYLLHKIKDNIDELTYQSNINIGRRENDWRRFLRAANPSKNELIELFEKTKYGDKSIKYILEEKFSHPFKIKCELYNDCYIIYISWQTEDDITNILDD